MSDPAIRAALRAAGDAVFAAVPEDAVASAEVIAAAAVAAFLRALPVGLPTAASPTEFRIASVEQRDAWAAAIEAAAREGGG